MKQIEFELKLIPEIAYQQEMLSAEICKILQSKGCQDFHWSIFKRSIDARSKNIVVNFKIIACENPPALYQFYNIDEYHKKLTGKKIIVIGAGPAGLFAALELLKNGIKPIIIERGKDVRARRRDLQAINQKHQVNPNSNYCFGAGGAGTYSDGKLYTRSEKRGNVRQVLEILVAHGAGSDILIDAHPHIGTNKLPPVVDNIIKTIISHGGEIMYNSTVIDFIISQNKAKGVITHNQKEIIADGIILATGHSARDIFLLLHHKNILIEAKPFALGVRVEHEQNLIDKIQYHCENRGLWLPPASYQLATQTYLNGIQKGVFSFCMCPGGFIVPAATMSGEIVVNGMSPSKRNAPFANSGIVVEINSTDWAHLTPEYGPLAAMRYQQLVEQQAFEISNHTLAAPAQKMNDFLNNKISSELSTTSYQPGLIAAKMDDFLPADICNRLRQAFKIFNKRMNGYVTQSAQLIGVESRTSSPVKIPRDPTTLQHPDIQCLFPCGEGAGYAGGIMSAALDGIRCARAAANIVR